MRRFFRSSTRWGSQCLEYDQRRRTATPNLAINPKSIHFGLNQDEIEEKPLTLSNVGDADLTYEIVVSENADGPNYSNGLRAMGRNYYGELGDGTKTQRTKPVQVEDKGIP